MVSREDSEDFGVVDRRADDWIPEDARRVRRFPFFWLGLCRWFALVLAIAGGLVLDAGLGWLAVPAGFAAMVGQVRRWICGACGNRVEKTARRCPVCGAGLR